MNNINPDQNSQGRPHFNSLVAALRSDGIGGLNGSISTKGHKDRRTGDTSHSADAQFNGKKVRIQDSDGKVVNITLGDLSLIGDAATKAYDSAYSNNQS
ncbi:MAG: hypothetical protein QG621_158 [Patescibacteria group bacterium]|nr:hypothetical protein [Patescibacteria group bacterium]